MRASERILSPLWRPLSSLEEVSVQHDTLAAWRRLGLTEDEPWQLEELELVAQRMAQVAWRELEDCRLALATIILQERGLQPPSDVV